MSKLDRLLNKERRLQRLREKKDLEEINIEKTLKTVEEQIKSAQRKQKEKKAKNQERIQKIKKGEIRVRKLYGVKSQLPVLTAPEIVLPEQLPEKLSHTASDLGSQLRRQYQRVFHQGLLEYNERDKIQRTHQLKFKSNKKPSRDRDCSELKFN